TAIPVVALPALVATGYTIAKTMHNRLSFWEEDRAHHDCEAAAHPRFEVERRDRDQWRCEGAVRNAVAEIRRARAEHLRREEERVAVAAKNAAAERLAAEEQQKKRQITVLLKKAFTHWRNVASD